MTFNFTGKNSVYFNAANNGGGIALVFSDKNSISNNNIDTNGEFGITVDYSDNNTINRNVVKNNEKGIYVNDANGNKITENDVLNNNYGIYLEDSGNNDITGNCVSDNLYGIYVNGDSDNNCIYHNNIIDNTNQAYDGGIDNAWDNGYPSGGNYWSDYAGVDLFSGPDQDLPGSDGIGDTDYTNILGGVSVDNYPLAKPAVDGRVQRPGIRIDSNTDFDALHGVTCGSGTEADPWIIENYDINGTGYGYCLYIGNTTDYFVVRNCYLHDASGVGTIPFYSDSGLTLYNVQHGTITDNTMSLNDEIGILLTESDNNAISHNIANFNNGYGGIVLEHSDGNTISGNTANSNNEFGIVMDYSDGNTAANNTACLNGYGGIFINDAYDCIVACNIFNSNVDYGIFFEDSVGTIITGNTASTNGYYGIYVNGDSYNSMIYHNNFIDNVNQAYDDGTNNAWDNGLPDGGNHWSDHYSCTGNPSVGYPYAIPGGTSVDYYPFEDQDGWL